MNWACLAPTSTHDATGKSRAVLDAIIDLSDEMDELPFITIRREPWDGHVVYLSTIQRKNGICNSPPASPACSLRAYRLN